MREITTISRSVEIGLHFIGIWPGTPYPGVHRFFWVTSMVVFQIFQYRFIFMHFDTDDLSRLVDALSTALSYTHLLIKLIIFWVNQSVFRDILTTMTADCQKYASLDSNDLVSKTTEQIRRLTNLIIGLYSSCVFFYAIGVLTADDIIVEGQEIPTRELFLNMELPFERNVSPAYELVMITQFLHQFSATTAVGILTATLLMVILHVGCQMDIMCERLSEVSSSDRKQLRFLVRRHQEIITFVENIERLFSYTALIQVLSNIFIICCLGFLIVVSIGTEDGLTTLVKCVLFYVVIGTEAFVICFAGQFVSTKSKMIGNAAYQSLWYDLQHSEAQTLSLLILRSQKELTISIGKFSNLSLETFTTIMKASASYISVLLAV